MDISLLGAEDGYYLANDSGDRVKERGYHHHDTCEMKSAMIDEGFVLINLLLRTNLLLHPYSQCAVVLSNEI